MTRCRALAAALGVVVLAGCTPSAPSLDLARVIIAEDAPPGMSWVASGAELTAGDDLHTIEHEWEDSQGEPAPCLPLYLVPYGVSLDDEGSDDRTVELGYFTLENYEGSILVNAREFPGDEAAADYLQHALEAASSCPGYRIGGYEVGLDGFAVARFSGGHGLVIDGGSVEDGVSSRTAVVRAGRTILIVDAFLHDAVEVDAGIVDRLALTMLERLDATT